MTCTSRDGAIGGMLLQTSSGLTTFYCRFVRASHKDNIAAVAAYMLWY